MTNRNQSFILNYILLTWCLVECNKLIRSVVVRGASSRFDKLQSMFVMFFCLLKLPTLLLTYLSLYVMSEQKVKDNIVYDSFSDKHWNMEGFFEVLETYYEGNPQLMAEDLVQAVKTMLLLKDSVIDDELKESAVHLLYLRDGIVGIEINQTL